MPIIKPTVGRKLYFIPGKHDTAIAWNDRGKQDPQPLDATINYVWGDHCINAAVVDNAGVTRMQNSCPLVQDGEPVPDGYYCYWMPFQVGQAQAVKALQASIPRADMTGEQLRGAYNAAAEG